MRGMRSHDERRLEEVLAHLLGAAAIVLEFEIAAALAPGRLFVAEPEAQELGGIVREEGLYRPLRAGGGGILPCVVAEAPEPLPIAAVREGLDAAVDVEALA